ncbi:uncharacterized protein [Rutidosis leptorrhynchoides]|uniref:uncharacterized protein n=1 Tax=Rutidosis leptorrhynchoides TaxID=125765 RepID=UPI003A9A5CF0
MKKKKNIGKVYPSSSSTPVTSPAGDSLSVLNLLPAAILSLVVVVLSLEDRQVLAYLITHSTKSTTFDNKKKNLSTHKPPVFDCYCFDCYTSYWFKWDSSPNRDLIHQAIEAFEESLTNNEQSKKKKKKGGKKKEKMGHRRLTGKAYIPEKVELLPEYDVALVEGKDEESVDEHVLDDDVAEEHSPELAEVVKDAAASHNHKGWARKVLPDVMGLFNWRLWSLWCPNV